MQMSVSGNSTGVIIDFFSAQPSITIRLHKNKLKGKALIKLKAVDLLRLWSVIIYYRL